MYIFKSWVIKFSIQYFLTLAVIDIIVRNAHKHTCMYTQISCTKYAIYNSKSQADNF